MSSAAEADASPGDAVKLENAVYHLRPDRRGSWLDLVSNGLAAATGSALLE